ncbi:coiled-coil domain-containing protein 60 [Rhinophrynus dorsalis]
MRQRKKDTNIFNKELDHTRQLIRSVRQGRGYFYLLHKEEQAKVTELQNRQHVQSVRLRKEPQPYRDCTDESSEEEELTSKQANETGVFLTELTGNQKKGKKMTSRPFTPVHNSLFSDQVLDANPESLFRQLCAIHWLLECLTLEPSIATRPVTTCWDLRDPGGCKTPLTRINREKEVEVKWEQFIMPGKAKKQIRKLPHSHLIRQRRASFLSTSRFSGLSSALPSNMGSVSSLVPNSDDMPTGGTTSSDAPQEGGEDLESTVNSSLYMQGKLNKEEDEEPLSDYLQKLIEMIAESVTKDLDEEESRRKHSFTRAPSSAHISPVREDQGSNKSPTQRPKSSPATSLSPSSTVIKKKSTMFSDMREMFFEVAEEADASLHDKVEAIERRRQEYNIQKYRSLDTISRFHQDLEKMRKAYHYVKEEKDYTDTNNWFGMLFSRIPPDMLKNQKIQKIMDKLEKLEERQFVRIRPNAFLKVLSGLRNWELCSPDISVAIEFVREHLVQMPLENYTAWLKARLASPQSGRIQSAPPMR